MVGVTLREDGEEIESCALQPARIIRHVTEFFRDFRIAEIAGGGIASAAERNSANMTFLAFPGVRLASQPRRD